MIELYLAILARLQAINYITITNGGSGYTSAPTITISNPIPTVTGVVGVTATAFAQITDGVVTNIIITNPGAGYTNPPIITFTGGGGSGASATATTFITCQLNGQTTAAFINMWNKQLATKSNAKNPDYSFTLPAIFIEFKSHNTIQLTQGVEIFDPLDIIVRIYDDFENASDSSMELNQRIFTFKQQVYMALKDFQPIGTVKFFRISEVQDYDHDNVYCYTQTYRTTYTDNSMESIVNGQAFTPATITVESNFG